MLFHFLFHAFLPLTLLGHPLHGRSILFQDIQFHTMLFAPLVDIDIPIQSFYLRIKLSNLSLQHPRILNHTFPFPITIPHHPLHPIKPFLPKNLRPFPHLPLSQHRPRGAPIAHFQPQSLPEVLTLSEQLLQPIRNTKLP